MFARLLFSLSFLILSATPAAAQRSITDMGGTVVSVPSHIARIATVGPVPVLNSLVFAVGDGAQIVNGLPPFAKRVRWAYQAIFAPQTVSLPTLQNADNTPDLEALLRAAPDVVLTMDRASAERVRRAGLPALYLAWRESEDIKGVVRLLGQLLNRQQAAERYAARFDSTLAEVGTSLRKRAPARPSVLYFSPATLTEPHLVVEWWIRAAGGHSVTDDGRSVESRSFTLEQLLLWNPDILIVASREEAEAVLHEARFSALAAVRNRHVLVAPCGAHTWANRTAEQPLTVLWAARQFHPALFADLDMREQTRRFYQDLFGVSLAAAQIDEILAGGPQAAPVRR